MSFVTIDHNAITAQSHIFTQLMIVTLFHIRTSFPILISQFVVNPHSIFSHHFIFILKGYVDIQSIL